jgi:transposase
MSVSAKLGAAGRVCHGAGPDARVRILALVADTFGEGAGLGLADMARDAEAFRAAARESGTIPVVPSRKGSRQPERYHAYIHRHCNVIERC